MERDVKQGNFRPFAERAENVWPPVQSAFHADDSDMSEVLGGGFIAEAVPQALVA